jgi:hypothetical protein
MSQRNHTGSPIRWPEYVVPLDPSLEWTPLDVNAPVAGVILATAELDCGASFRCWRVVSCPYCGESHDHGSGPVNSDPRRYLGGRLSHCFPGGEYRLVPSVFLKAKRVQVNTDVRADVWDKSHGFCWYCGIQMHPFRNFHVDHVNPVVNGGTNEIQNLVPSCQSCNSKKRARPAEFLRKFMADGTFWFERVGKS